MAGNPDWDIVNKLTRWGLQVAKWVVGERKKKAVMRPWQIVKSLPWASHDADGLERPPRNWFWNEYDYDYHLVCEWIAGIPGNWKGGWDGMVGWMKGIICMIRICLTTGAQHRDYYDGFSYSSNIRGTSSCPSPARNIVPSLCGVFCFNYQFISLHSPCHFIKMLL